MAANPEKLSELSSAEAPAPVVIVGAGPVGMRAAEELLRRDPRQSVVIYGDEPWEPYDRVLLSSLLAGETRFSSLFRPLSTEHASRIQQYHNCRITRILPRLQLVIDESGRSQPYQSLILAIGSRPHIPGVQGINLDGIYTFRDLSDAQVLRARQQKSRRTVIVGGGLLGLETARAMQRENIEVSVVDHSPWLMSSQLDAEAAAVLHEHMLSRSIRCYLGNGIRSFEGNGKVERVVLQDGRVIECDTVILATGIRPNVELALDAGIAIGRGIKVDDGMRTSVPFVYAIGDCVEHRGKVSGLVAPGLEQAAVAVHSISGGRARFTGSIAAARLKVVDLPVFSMGTIDEFTTSDSLTAILYQNQEKNIYRKIVLRRNRVVGAIALGEWSSLNRLQPLISRRGILWPWQKIRFLKSGDVWPRGETDLVVNWPNSAVVCTCTGVTRGQLASALKEGCSTVSCMAEKTRASTVCGSCRPQLAELVGENVTEAATSGNNWLIGISVAAAIVSTLLFLLQPLQPAVSVAAGWHVSELWLDGLLKQISGYSIAGLAVISLLVSARKRLKKFQFGEFSSWRIFHISLGVLTLCGLFVHTGFALGSNLNMWLMTNFLVVALIGSAAGGVAAAENRIGGALGRRLRRWWNRIHLLAAWPLPVLIISHVLSVYYF